MKEYGDTRHQKTFNENELEGKKEKFNMTNFDIAVFASNFFDNSEVDLAGHFEWSIQSYEHDFRTHVTANLKSIGLHPCTKDEFENKFPDTDGSFYSQVSCIDSLEGIEVYGNEKSGKASFF